MPSIVGAFRQRNGVNGSQPPPSSLATHLAPSKGSTFPHFDAEDFTLLLKESLGSDEEGRPNLGTDVFLNHKLICVIITAGFDSIDLRSSDPFCIGHLHHEQVQKCLEVIGLTIERTPGALFVLTKPEDLGPRAENVPLFIWLIPKLLSLLALDNNDSKFIAGCVWPLLGKMLALAEQCSNGSELCISVATYLEELTEGTSPPNRIGYRSDNRN